jgi:hypothetical protein
MRRVNVPATGLTFGHLTGKPLRLFNQGFDGYVDNRHNQGSQGFF